MKNKELQKKLRHQRVRKKVIGISERPRLVVFRSNQNIYAQLIDDSTSSTITASSDLSSLSSKKNSQKVNKSERAAVVGMNLAQKATRKKIKNVVFDRGAYKFHGRVKALAEGARKGGLVF